MKPGAVRRYLTVVAIILAVLVAAGIWLKPPLAKMREGVDAGLTEYARQHLKPGEAMPVVTHTESHDWGIAVSHVAMVGEKTFFCVGAFKVTICDFAN
jgi:hypothetical protein